MAVALLFSGQTVLGEFAAGLAAFPGAGMGFTVFAECMFGLAVYFAKIERGAVLR